MQKDAIKNLCVKRRAQLPKQEMLTFIGPTNGMFRQARTNPYSHQHSNIVRDSLGNFIMETGGFGGECLALARLLRKPALDIRHAVWFYVPAENIVPKHIDENYGGIIRNRMHYTVNVSSPKSTFLLGDTVAVFDEISFSPFDLAHGAHAIEEDLWVVQCPMK